MASAFVWQVSPAPMAAKAALLARGFPAEVDALAAEVAVEGEAYGKINAPWSNRTGMARASLRGTSTVAGGSGEIVFAHGQDYGIWLELANQGVYGIVPATVAHMVTELGNGLDGMLERVA